MQKATVLSSVFLLLATLALPARASPVPDPACAGAKAPACRYVNWLAAELNNNRPADAHARIVRFEAQGPVLVAVHKLHILAEEWVSRVAGPGSLNAARLQQELDAEALAISCAPNQSKLFEALFELGGARSTLSLSLDDVPLGQDWLFGCGKPVRTQAVSAGDLRKVLDQRHQKAVKWEDKSNLWIYSSGLGCFHSEYGTVLSPWGKRVAERESKWTQPDAGDWAARTTYSEEGDSAVYYHFETQQKCQAFERQLKQLSARN